MLAEESEHMCNGELADRWIVCFLIGVVTAFVAAFIDILVFRSSRLKFHVIINTRKAISK